MPGEYTSLKGFQITQQQKPLKALVIGESCTDVYMYGTCSRLSPEAPIPVLDFSEHTSSYGMAKNVSKNLAAFGFDVSEITNNASLLIKTRFIDKKSNQQILRVDDSGSIDPAKNFPTEAPDVAIISDYNKGFLTQEYLTSLIDFLSVWRIPIFVDSKRSNLSCFNNCIIKVNDFEAASITKLPKINYQIITTRGKDGCTWRGHTFPAPIVDAYDVTGAGDVFIASLASMYVDNKELLEIIPKAIRLASISVKHSGTYTVTKDDIMNLEST